MKDGNKVFPSLSLPAGNFQPGRTYETGELAMLGRDTYVRPGKKHQIRHPDSGGRWKEQRLANEQDRLMLPKLFTYSFQIPQLTAGFILKNSGGSVLNSVSATGAGP
jgi:hypothetical protein